MYDVIKPCLDDGDGNIIGKCLFTSTVEEMNEKAMKENVDLWTDSDQSDLDDYGQTITGLYRFFISALENRKVDDYGYAPIEENRKYFQNERDKLKDDPKKLAAHKRKFPWNWKEAFAMNTATCPYDPIRTEDMIQRQRMLKKPTRFDLVWNNPEDWSEGVKIREKSNGMYYHCMGEDFDMSEFENAFKVQGNLFRPTNLFSGVIGIDPYDHDDTKTGVSSLGAGAALRRWQPQDDEECLYSDNFIIYYLGRPPKSKDFYEDMLKMCLLTGYRALVEDNKPGLGKWFEEVGALPFLYVLKGAKKWGISASPKSHKHLVECTEAHLDEGGYDKNQFLKMGEGWMEFDITNTTKHDLPMADGWACVAENDMSSVINNATRKLKKTKTKGKAVFRSYNI